MFAKAIFIAAVTGLATMGANSAPLTNDQAQTLKIINDARVSADVPALLWDATLQDNANGWAEKIAVAGYLEHAPASQRNGAGEILGFIHAADSSNIVLRAPLTESVKLWLNSENMTKSAVHYAALSKTDQLLSINATEIGCGTAYGIDGNVARDPLRVFTVCRDFGLGPFTGDITFFNPALGACGQVDNDSSMIVVLSHIKMGSRFNGNSLCGRKAHIRGPNGEATVLVTDKCMDCAVNNIDISPAVFEAVVGDKGSGRASEIEWYLI